MSMCWWVLSVAVRAEYLISDKVNGRVQLCDGLTCLTVAGTDGIGSGGTQLNRPWEVAVTEAGEYVVADFYNDRHPVVFSGQRGLVVHHHCWHHRIHRSGQHGALPFQWTRFRWEWRSPGCGCPEPPRPTVPFRQSRDGLCDGCGHWHVGTGCRRAQSSDGCRPGLWRRLRRG